MIRLLCALGALLVLFVLGESFLREHQRTVRRTAGALRLLTPEPTSAVDQIEVHAAGRRWHYVRRGNTWYFPAYHRAFVVNRRVEHLLQSLLATPATFVSAEPGDLARYGLGPGSVRIHLLDQQGRPLLEVRQGRGAPGGARGNRMSSALMPTASSTSTPTPSMPSTPRRPLRCSTAASCPNPYSARASGALPSPATLPTRCNPSAAS